MPTAQLPLLRALTRMQPGEHCCGIFRSDAEQRQVVIDFARLGIERNEKMLYLFNVQTAEQLKATLFGAGMDVDALIGKGQFVLLSAKEAYLAQGEFDPDKMIAMLGREVAAARAEGYTALRVTGEMTWALAGDPGAERLIEYEAKLNQFYASEPYCYSICQYDQRRFDAGLLLDVMHTHPQLLLGTESFDNTGMYYVPPEAFLSPNRSNGILERWLGNLSQRQELQ